VNSPAQKLLPSARRKRGALQGVNVLVNCSHVVPGLNGRSGKSVVRSHKQTIANISPANKRRDRTDYSVEWHGLFFESVVEPDQCPVTMLVQCFEDNPPQFVVASYSGFVPPVHGASTRCPYLGLPFSTNCNANSLAAFTTAVSSN
jgi:hypothetical protein